MRFCWRSTVCIRRFRASEVAPLCITWRVCTVPGRGGAAAPHATAARGARPAQGRGHGATPTYIWTVYICICVHISGWCARCRYVYIVPTQPTNMHMHMCMHMHITCTCTCTSQRHAPATPPCLVVRLVVRLGTVTQGASEEPLFDSDGVAHLHTATTTDPTRGLNAWQQCQRRAACVRACA